ncbi:zinc-binding alcohol dehydrogenase family protein [Sulfitobacter sp.]|uniref:zinc-binding alcohol dehydrogenase family protein n=1 Tax=Sulfitobacter sp. TaxID=1903071 RepID=UPI003002C5FD
MPSMKTIAAFEALSNTDPNCFVVVEEDTPVATGKDLLIHIDAISVNPVDYKDRLGISGHRETPLVLGWDACGEVIAIGDDVTGFKVGDKVISAGDISRQGSYAQYQLVDERITALKPAGLSDEQAATLPLTTLAAWEALFDRLGISDADEVEKPALLIIGGAGGLGSMAVQFARQFSSCTVIATASRPETKDWCLELGAHHVIDHSEDIQAQLRELGYEDVPYILNCSNNIPYWKLMSRLIAPEGAICLVASTKAKLDLDLFMEKSVRINYMLMFTRSLFKTKTMQLQGDLLARLSDMISSGKVRHVMTKELGPMTRASLAHAHALLESGRMVGKIRLTALRDEVD